MCAHIQGTQSSNLAASSASKKLSHLSTSRIFVPSNYFRSLKKAAELPLAEGLEPSNALGQPFYSSQVSGKLSLKGKWGVVEAQ